MLKIIMSIENELLQLHAQRKRMDGIYFHYMPDIGLHPTKQLDLGSELFNEYIMNRKMLIYTHSELLLLYFMKQFSEHPFAPDLNINDLSVDILLSIKRSDETGMKEFKIHTVNFIIDENGTEIRNDFPKCKEWPYEFFYERDQLLF